MLLEPAAGLKLRRECFGGIAFQAETGLSADLDRAAFQLLSIVKENGAVDEAVLLGALPSLGLKKSSPREAKKVLAQLSGLGLLVRRAGYSDPAVKPPVGPGLLVIPEVDWPSTNILTAPETVHWAVTYRCRSCCPDCYARRFSPGDGEMSTVEALKAVAVLAEWGVFQLAIGGGEPLLRPDLADLASAAADLGMVVHLTTGMAVLPEKEMVRLAAVVKVLQFNVDEHRLVNEPEPEMERLRRGLQAAAGAGMITGANLKVSRTTAANFKTILDRLGECGFDRITLLRYKPPPDYERWLAENPSAKSLLAFELFLAEAAADWPHLTFRVDCALGFLFRRLGEREARGRGIRGCVAAGRIAALDPLGNLLPCSQLAYPRFRAGNILSQDPGLIWRESRVFKKYRFFRNKASFKQCQCGVCKAGAYCGGCRVFAGDALGADPFCPDPLWPPLEQLGKHGRRVDIERYVKEKGCISVGEYMERYAVGQEKAVKELRDCFLLMGVESGATGRKMNDCYSISDDDPVADIQDMIGHTSGGVPFAAAEEIRGWLEEDDPDLKYRGYPLWLVGEGALDS